MCCMTTQVYLDRFSYQIIKNGDQSVCVYFCMCQFCLFESYGLYTGISYTHTMYVTLVIPLLPEGGGGYTVLPLSICPSFRPSNIFFVALFSVTVDGRNLIFGHKRHIGNPYCGKRFWTHQIPTSCLPTYLVFIHIEHICSFFVAFFLATIDGRNLILGHKLHIGTPYRGKRFLTLQIPTSCLPKSGGITVHLVYFIIVVSIKYKFLTFGSETSESNAKWN